MTIFQENPPNERPDKIYKGKEASKHKAKDNWKDKRTDCIHKECNHGDCSDSMIAKKTYHQLKKITHLLELLCKSKGIKF